MSADNILKTETDVFDDPDASKLIVALMQANAANTASVTSTVIDNLDAKIARLEAELGLVRTRIVGLLSEPYMPHPYYIEDALWPDPARVAALAKASLEKKRKNRESS